MINILLKAIYLAGYTTDIRYPTGYKIQYPVCPVILDPARYHDGISGIKPGPDIRLISYPGY